MNTFGIRRQSLPVAAALLAALCLSACSGGPSFRSCPDSARAIPLDLPQDPDPTKKYCKVWVPPTYREVPYLAQRCSGTTRDVTETVMETRAYDEIVTPASCKTVRGCGKTCEESLVQVRPGGYRWEFDGTCWKYVERCPEYEWCNRVVREDSIDYCMDVPAEYQTKVETVPVQRTRTEYVPPRYEIRYRQEVFQPGRWEWRTTCSDGCTPDRRPTRTHLVERKCESDCKPAVKSPGPLDCGCARTN